MQPLPKSTSKMQPPQNFALWKCNPLCFCHKKCNPQHFEPLELQPPKLMILIIMWKMMLKIRQISYWWDLYSGDFTHFTLEMKKLWQISRITILVLLWWRWGELNSCPNKAPPELLQLISLCFPNNL